MSQSYYLKSCASTNDVIRPFLDNLPTVFSLYTFDQTSGRGQYGNSWQTSKDKNLAFSFAVKAQNLTIPFELFNFYTASLIRDIMAKMTHLPFEIKWPNDLILQKKKVAGMLIERFSQSGTSYYIIGIGVNVLGEINREFSHASSIFHLTGKQLPLHALATELHEGLKSGFIESKLPTKIIEYYEQHLFQKDKVAVYEWDSVRQNGIIRGVTPQGELLVENENGKILAFYHKHIKMLY